MHFKIWFIFVSISSLHAQDIGQCRYHILQCLWIRCYKNTVRLALTGTWVNEQHSIRTHKQQITRVGISRCIHMKPLVLCECYDWFICVLKPARRVCAFKLTSTRLVWTHLKPNLKKTLRNDFEHVLPAGRCGCYILDTSMILVT